MGLKGDNVSFTRQLNTQQSYTHPMLRYGTSIRAWPGRSITAGRTEPAGAEPRGLTHRKARNQR